ncbi:single-strand DNA-binding protein [Moraxella cuniculi DSM 21768]|uniref:Single-stranded DNA-binding protein n=1 Tax=Moraxella cuniculi DSM 21768 TaxID=1122245 RepID=A0A1N7ECZ1_9GAMM|nr:single-stranded DNA-binding protein [Moraxella cuniculi]OOS05341.1 hypothetical protein B0189_06965 [Moraxella cuniculi]SIR85946.1 single-strand DNA-binding protein [Moraxella cuniculi DSM 21768]
MSVNIVILIGRLGQDPEGKSFQNGGMIAHLSVATKQKWKDLQGDSQERIEWHRVVLHNKLADFGMTNLTKGSLVYVEGSLKHRQYQDRQNTTRYITEIEAKLIHPLD